jgi:hypothetical protein
MQLQNSRLRPNEDRFQKLFKMRIHTKSSAEKTTVQQGASLDSKGQPQPGSNAGFGGIMGRGGRMIRKLKSGAYRLYSRKLNPRTGKKRNLGTFDTLEEAERHERAVQFFKRKA